MKKEVLINDLPAAEQYFTRAVAPGLYGGVESLHLARVLFRQMRYKESIATLAQLKQHAHTVAEESIDGVLAGANENQAIDFFRTNQLDSALVYFTTALMYTHSSRERIYNNIGSVYGAMGRTEQALVFFEKSLQTNPDYAQARDNSDHVLATELCTK